jgi:hypothetical protein
MSVDGVTKVQIMSGSDAGAIPCRLSDQQRAGQACLVCGRETGPESPRAKVGYVDGEPVFIYTYCSGDWQRGAVRAQ